MNRIHRICAGSKLIWLSCAYLLCGGSQLPAADDYELLLQRHLSLPLRHLAAGDIRDTFHDRRDGGKQHEATDILAPRDTPIVSVEDGVIQKLFLSKPGGLTI